MNRTEELARLLSSLQAQTYASFRVLIADQNEDDRLHSLLDEFGSLELIRVRSSPGLSRARNAALTRIDADVIAFPDDDCLFPADLLQRVASRFASDETLAGMTGRSESAAGESSASWRRGRGR